MWHTLRSPEVCIFEMAVDVMTHLVNDAGDAVRHGPPLLPDQRRNDIYDQVSPPPMAPLSWPDREGRFPWEDDAADSCRDNQPLLWIPGSVTAGPWGTA